MQPAFLDVAVKWLRDGHLIYSVEHDDVFLVSSVDKNERSFTLSNNTMYIYRDAPDVVSSHFGLYLVPLAE